MEITLPCKCTISDKGVFTVGFQCVNCVECNAVSKLHPFGRKRFSEPPKTI
jgi:hypothetical protein